MLEHYETDLYSVEGIRITIEEKERHGRTFMWADNPTELMGGDMVVERWRNGAKEGNDISANSILIEVVVVEI
jgi:hypothetical protein